MEPMSGSLSSGSRSSRLGLSERLQALADLEVWRLIREELGPGWNFKTERWYFEHLQRLFRRLLDSPLDSLPTVKLNGLSQAVDAVGDLYMAILSFQPGDEGVRLHLDIALKLEAAYNEVLLHTLQAVGGATLLPGEGGAKVRPVEGSLSDFQAERERQRERYELRAASKDAEPGRRAPAFQPGFEVKPPEPAAPPRVVLPEPAEAEPTAHDPESEAPALEPEIAAELPEQFAAEARSHKRASFIWLAALSLLGGGIILAAWWSFNHYQAQAQDFTAYQTIQLSLTKIIVAAVLLTALVLSVQVYWWHRRHCALNQQRANALLTFQRLAAAAQDVETKRAVLLQAAHWLSALGDSTHDKTRD